MKSQRVSAVPERAKQGTDALDLHMGWAEGSIWTERMVSALVNGVKGGKWFSLVDKVIRPTTLDAAWHKVARNKGAAGVDGQSIERFAAQSERYLQELHECLKDGSYRPHPVKRVEIPKGDGRTRPLGIPTVKDRIVQTALKMVIEPIFEVQFRPGSYGFRPGRSCKDALREVDRLLKEGFTFVVDADLQGYFDSIPQDRLMTLVETSISDGRVLALIDGFLRQDIMTAMAQWTPTAGTPQGAVISPLLANLYLHPLDLLMEQSGLRMVRYADDFVILCRSEDEAQAALRRVAAWVTANGLTLHPDKTRVGDCRQPGHGFEFLGYRFEAGRRLVRKKSLQALKDKVRAKTGRSRGDSLERIVLDLNPVLRGWFGYFKHATPALFGVLDGFVRRRLRALLRKQEKRPGIGRCAADHHRWPNAFFAARGLFTLRTAFVQARHSR
jgi:RNA-directed DNA polymerase